MFIQLFTYLIRLFSFSYLPTYKHMVIHYDWQLSPARHWLGMWVDRNTHERKDRLGLQKMCVNWQHSYRRYFGFLFVQWQEIETQQQSISFTSMCYTVSLVSLVAQCSVPIGCWNSQTSFQWCQEIILTRRPFSSVCPEISWLLALLLKKKEEKKSLFVFIHVFIYFKASVD